VRRLQWLGISNVELGVVLIVLVVSCFSICDLERALLLAGHRTLWMPFGVLQSFFFRVVSCCWAIGISTICHLALSLILEFNL
jgi:hypothetical protein